MANVENPKLRLYSYWRSSCAFRVRIALNLKGLKYEYKAVNLVTGEQYGPEFIDVNPLGYVPALVDGDLVLSDSFAIIMYLEEKYPQNPLLPRDLHKKAINYQAANIVSSSIQPLQNLAVLKYVEEKAGPDEKLKWAKFHIEKGFTALEKLLKDHAGKYATGDEIYMLLEFVKQWEGCEKSQLETDASNYFYINVLRMEPKEADLFLAPQLHAGKRFNVDMDKFPILSRLNDAYNELQAFKDALPEKQPDAPASSTS